MPRHKRRTKRGRSTNQPRADTSALVTYVDRIDSQPTWDAVCRDLCEVLESPNLESRNGIKRVHTEFERIQEKLEISYDRCNNSDKIQGGVVMIWAKLSMDGFLRTKILAADVIPKICSLLSRSPTRMIALQALSTITSYGDDASRRNIASDCVSPLLKLMEEYPYDVALNQQVIIILAHVVESVVIDDNTPPLIVASVIRALNLPRILRLILANIRRPRIPCLVFHHALQLFAVSCSRCPEEVNATPVIDILVASLRSTDLSTRATALIAIILLTGPGDDGRQGSPRVDITKLMDLRQLPAHLKHIIAQDGSEDGDTLQTIRCTEEYRDAMVQCVDDHDLYTLGMRISRVVVRTDIGLTGGWPTPNSRPGREEFMDVGLPFKLWQDAAPHCIKALRERGTPADLDAANIIELRRMFNTCRTTEVVQFALKAIQRSPHVAFFYYAVGLGSDFVIGLRHLKKGMKCEGTLTPYLRRAMTRLAVSRAGTLALGILGRPDANRSNYALGIAFLMSAHEDAKSFVECAAADTRNIIEMLHWRALLEVAIRGPEISLDLRELEPITAKLQPAKDFLGFLKAPIPSTLVELARDAVVKRYASAWCDWGDVITNMDDQHYMATNSDAHQHSVAHAEANLAGWLEGIAITDGPVSNKPSRIHPYVNPSLLALYKCSYCYNPSAILRKCSGCGQTRYCDVHCQRAHWSRHNAVCKATPAEE